MWKDLKQKEEETFKPTVMERCRGSVEGGGRGGREPGVGGGDIGWLGGVGG